MSKKRAAEDGLSEKKDERPVLEVAQGSALPLDEFRRVALSGAFRRIVVESDWTHFRIRGDFTGGGHVNLLKTKQREIRRFLNPAAALILLRRMGVVRAEIEMREWDVEMASLTTRMRPDVTARRLRRQKTAGLELVREAAKLHPELLIQLPPANEYPSDLSREEERLRLLKQKKLRKQEEERIAEANEKWKGDGPPEIDIDKLNLEFNREFYQFKGWPPPYK